ncbi:LOW QUALITY PROTEIN: mitoregulin [Tupaia chinensis]|nr:LOW QUALITY PROTEIN: mitoregulin [Tupaia chinensis]
MPPTLVTNGRQYRINIQTVTVRFRGGEDRSTLSLRTSEGAGGRDLSALASSGPRAPPENALRRLTPPLRRRPGCASAVAMADVSERTLQVSVLVAFASGVLVGWQANRLRRRYLDWRKKRLQDKLAVTQKKLDLA